MNRGHLKKAPWVDPWCYRTEALALGWPLSRWMFYTLLGTSFVLGMSLGGLLNMPWLGLGMGCFFTYAIPGELLEWVRHRRQKKMRQIWIETLRLLHTAYLVSGEWRRAITISLPHLPEVSREVFQEILQREQLGTPIQEAITAIQARFPIPEITFFFAIIQLLERVGGPTGEALFEDVIKTSEEANTRVEEIESEVAARQTETRHLFILFLVELVFLRIMGRFYFGDLFNSFHGHMLIAGLFTLNAACLIWVKQQIRSLAH